MDYEKPEALNPQVYHHGGHQSPQPDGEATLHGFDEPVVPEEKREYRSDSLWYGFSPKQTPLAFTGYVADLCVIPRQQASPP
jgi:amino acid transporter